MAGHECAQWSGDPVHRRSLCEPSFADQIARRRLRDRAAWARSVITKRLIFASIHQNAAACAHKLQAGGHSGVAATDDNDIMLRAAVL
jgi:hypothetical protein